MARKTKKEEPKEKRAERLQKRIDKLINIMVVVAITAIATGIIIAIWAGIVGLKIAGTGAAVLGEAYIMYWIIKQLRREDKESNENAGH